MIKSLITASALTLLFCHTAAAQAGPDSLSMTIYGNNQALVSDTRDITFKSGLQTIALPGVSSQINAPTATFIADNIEIVEQNFDFDLLTPQKLMQKAVGKTVTLVRTNPGTGAERRQKAKVLSVNDGVVIETDGKIEVLRDDNIPTRVIFDDIPENLRARPTLSVMVDSARAGRREAALTYLTTGLGWRADYVMLFDEAAKKMNLQGWATLTNNTETTFKDTQTSLVAGHVGQSGRNQYNRNYNRRGNVRSGGTEQSPQERIGDNYLYPLPGRTTIASRQTKQVGFVEAEGVAAQKVYEYEASGFQTSPDPRNAEVRVVFTNSRAAGLGEALPKGTIRVYTKDKSGRSQFIGEDTISHVAGGSELALKIGEAFDVTVKPVLESQNIISKRRTDHIMKYEIKNAQKKPINVTIRQRLWGWRTEYSIREENHSSRAPDAFSRVWSVPVPAEGTANLRFTIRETRSY